MRSIFKFLCAVYVNWSGSRYIDYTALVLRKCGYATWVGRGWFRIGSNANNSDIRIYIKAYSSISFHWCFFDITLYDHYETVTLSRVLDIMNIKYLLLTDLLYFFIHLVYYSKLTSFFVISWKVYKCLKLYIHKKKKYIKNNYFFLLSIYL